MDSVLTQDRLAPDELRDIHDSLLTVRRRIVRDLADVDATVLVLEAGRTTDADRAVIRLLPEGANVVVALNKIDRQKDRDALLPQMAELAALCVVLR